MNRRNLLWPIVWTAGAVCAASGVATAAHFPVYSTWPQPGGPGASITLTYSFSNLLDGSLRDAGTGQSFPADILRGAFEAAFLDYARVLPISFREVLDQGPAPESGPYAPMGLADIRIGQVPHIDDANAYAYFPGSASAGLGGDIVFNAGRFGAGWSVVLFYAVAQHELGHSLGIGHEVAGDPPSVPAMEEAAYGGPLIPLAPGAIAALQAVYGTGSGTVTPLSAVPAPAAWKTLVAGLAALALFVRQRLRRRNPGIATAA